MSTPSVIDRAFGRSPAVAIGAMGLRCLPIVMFFERGASGLQRRDQQEVLKCCERNHVNERRFKAAMLLLSEGMKN